VIQYLNYIMKELDRIGLNPEQKRLRMDRHWIRAQVKDYKDLRENKLPVFIPFIKVGRAFFENKAGLNKKDLAILRKVIKRKPTFLEFEKKIGVKLSVFKRIQEKFMWNNFHLKMGYDDFMNVLHGYQTGIHFKYQLAYDLFISGLYVPHRNERRMMEKRLAHAIIIKRKKIPATGKRKRVLNGPKEGEADFLII
jgi:hypothetical protein